MGRTCEQCGVRVPFGVKRRRVGDKLVCDGCLNDRPGMPRSQVNRMGSMQHVAEFPPKKDSGSSDGPPPPKPKGMPGQAPAMPPAGAPPMGMNPMDPMDPMGMGMGMGQPAQPQQPQFAPDQQSDLVVRVCPFCGSGHLIGSSDGSISCGYCEANFTITVMPSHPFQPLVNPEDGSPFVMPTNPEADANPQIGTAAPDGSPGEGPADPTEQTPVGQPNINTSPPPGDPGGGDLLRQGDPSSPGPLDAAFEQVMSGAAAMAAPVPEDAAQPGQVPTPVPGAPPQLDGASAPDDEDEDDEQPGKKKKSAPPWAKQSALAEPIDIVAIQAPDRMSYEIHKADCQDLKQMKYSGCERYRAKGATSVVDAAKKVYPPRDFGWDPNDPEDAEPYTADFRVHNCAKTIKQARFVTAAGTVLDEDAYVAHLRRTVLAQGDLRSRVAHLAAESLG